MCGDTVKSLQLPTKPHSRGCESTYTKVLFTPPTMCCRTVNPNFARNHNTHTYPISLQLADTMCHAPAGMKSLKALGKTIGWEKIQLNEGDIEHMDRPHDEFASAGNVINCGCEVIYMTEAFARRNGYL